MVLSNKCLVQVSISSIINHKRSLITNEFILNILENCKDFHFRGLWLWLHLDPDVNTHWIIEKEDTEASKQGHSADQWLQDHPHGASDLQHIIMSNHEI